MTAKPTPRTTPQPGYQPLSEWKTPAVWTTEIPAVPGHGDYATVTSLASLATSSTGALVYLNTLEPTYSMGVRFALNHASNTSGLTGTVYVFGFNGTAGADEMNGEYLGEVTVTSGPTAIAEGSKMLGAKTGNSYWAGEITVNDTSLDTAEFRAHEDPDAGKESPAWLRITKNYTSLLFVLVSDSGVSMRMAYREFNSLV